MQFKNPVFLYALFLLIIPILIHLFQLRKFKKTPFTNVALLKVLSIQSRKSSEIKKWIILSLRLLALAALILAFAQPYIPASNQAEQQTTYSIYLDNSFSMQMPSQRGNLLKEAQQQLIEMLPQNAKINFITNNSTKTNLTKKEFQNEVLATSFTNQQLNYTNAILKTKQLNTAENNNHKIILISDFQQQQDVDINQFENEKNISFIQVQPQPKINFSISSIDFDESRQLLQIQLDASTANNNTVPLSVFSEEKLLAKQQVQFQNSTTTQIEVSITENEVAYGKIEIEDDALQYDNTFYFSINPSPKINVWCIYEDDGSFVQRIFNNNEFNFEASSIKALDYAKFNNQNTIVLNAIKKFEPQLQNSLIQFAENGGSIVIIPAIDADLKSYNSVLKNLQLPTFDAFHRNQQKITNINFSHPILNNVFSQQVTNFEYPLTRAYFSLSKPNKAVLRYANQEAFLASAESNFVFAANLSNSNSNFTTSPLVVPILYNIGRRSILKQNIFDFTNQIHQYQINAQLGNDEVVELVIKEEVTIPQQQQFNASVRFNTAEINLQAGTYQVKANQETIKHISFNHSRDESQLNYYNLNQNKNLKSTTIAGFFADEVELNQIDEYWKGLLIFALLFLILEMLALRFIK